MKRTVLTLSLYLMLSSSASARGSSGASLEAYTEFQPSMVVALHHSRQSLLRPGEMSFTPKLWFGSARSVSGAIQGGAGFAYEGPINDSWGFGLAIGTYDGTGVATGVAGSVRRRAAPTKRLNVSLQGVLGYVWNNEPGGTSYLVPDRFGDLREEFLVDDASWATAYVHAIADYELGPLRPVAELGFLLSRASVGGSERTGPGFDEFDAHVVNETTIARVAGGAGLALDLGRIDAYLGGGGYDGGAVLTMSVTLTIN